MTTWVRSWFYTHTLDTDINKQIILPPELLCTFLRSIQPNNQGICCPSALMYIHLTTCSSQLQGRWQCCCGLSLFVENLYLFLVSQCVSTWLINFIACLFFCAYLSTSLFLCVFLLFFCTLYPCLKLFFRVFVCLSVSIGSVFVCPSMCLSSMSVCLSVLLSFCVCMFQSPYCTPNWITVMVEWLKGDVCHSYIYSKHVINQLHAWKNQCCYMRYSLVISHHPCCAPIWL